MGASPVGTAEVPTQSFRCPKHGVLAFFRPFLRARIGYLAAHSTDVRTSGTPTSCGEATLAQEHTRRADSSLQKRYPETDISDIVAAHTVPHPPPRTSRESIVPTGPAPRQRLPA